MLGLQDTASWAADEAKWLLYVRGLMFTWNLLLAFVPLALALLLFRTGVRRTPIWWGGIVTFVLFLPNAAYVLTDVVHLLNDVRAGTSDVALMTVYGPAYGLFFALGFSFYVLSLIRLQEYLRDAAPRVRWWPVELGLHALVAVGIFLGRVMRLNSWDVLHSPGEVTDSIPLLATRFPVLFMAFTFVVLVVLTAIAKPALRAGTNWSRRVGRLIGHRVATGPPVGMA